MGIVDEIRGNHFIGGVGEDSFHVGFAGLFHGGADFGVAGFAGRFDREIDYGNRGSGDAEGHSREFAFDFGNDETDRASGAGGGGDDIDGGAASTLPVFAAGSVDRLLGGGVAMDGGHETFFDAKAFGEKDMNDGCQAIGGAAGIGDDVMVGGEIFLVIHAHDHGDIFVFSRGGNDDFFGAGGDVSAGFGGFGEEASGFDDDIDAEFFPGEGGGAFLDGEATDFVAIDHEEIIFGEIGVGFFAVDLFFGAALGGVVFDQIREVISGDEVIDRDHFDFCAEKALVADCPKNEATDAPETIDADFDHIL